MCVANTKVGFSMGIYGCGKIDEIAHEPIEVLFGGAFCFVAY